MYDRRYTPQSEREPSPMICGAADRAAQPSQSTSVRRALVVDDDEAERSRMASLLKHAGYVVSEATNGAEGLAAVAREQPELLLIEIVLPETDGLEVIQRVRKQHPKTTILAVSGSPRAHGYLSAARLLGAHRTLYKPLSSDRLQEALAPTGQESF
ncbi:MAG TPA: response regulator [Bryobacteraceae bacterium]|nr:response regulator [Bryobacteraceae bacterium]